MNTVLLSGWTQPSDALAHLEQGATLFDYSDYPDVDSAVAALRALNPARIIGWSLGGQLALRAIAIGALSPRHLTVIAAPLQFIGDEKRKGMDPTTYQLFRESYAKDPVRTMARFHALLAKGDSAAKHVMVRLSHHSQAANTARWLPWLDALAAARLDVSTLASAPPTLIIHGMNDAIVPVAQSEALADALPEVTLAIWADAGHAPHVHDGPRLVAAIAAHRQQHGVA